MRLVLAYISARRELKSPPAQALVTDFMQRTQRYAPISIETFRSEGALLESAERRPGRTVPCLVLLDSQGRPLTSAQFADELRRQRDAGVQECLLCIGPPDGWSSQARARANLLFSLGAITLPHELALLVLAEQVYRALTILAGHPYHCGHE